MLVSFIVPAFNRAHYLGRAIESVLSQCSLFTRGLEVIVIDDGSTDGTDVVLREYAGHPNVSVVRFEANRGLAAARNAGFDRASGQWCALLDSDNALLPNVARDLERLLISVPPDVGVLWVGSSEKGGRSMTTHGRRGRIPGLETIRHPLQGEHFPFIRTEVARKNRYPELGTRHACEPAFWAAMSRVTDYWIEPRPFQYYETAGSDRFCALESRLRKARELAVCYSHTAAVIRSDVPRYYWELEGKAAFYRSVAGDWLGSIQDGLAALRGALYVPRNFGIMLACLAGPRATRWLLRRQSAR